MRKSSSISQGLVAASLFARSTIAGYALTSSFTPSTFFSSDFDFFTGTDPTAGFVKFVDAKTATDINLIGVSNTSVYIGVDSTNVTPNGRPSVRLSSKKSFDKGLLIVDVQHMPGGMCGSWPALWLLGSGTWPDKGEIDIVEGVNQQLANAMTLHTNADCVVDNPSTTASGDSTSQPYLGNLLTPDCDINASGQPKNAGCSISASNASSPSTYGTEFNARGGGIYATEWTSSGISIWFFPRSGSIPSDITTDTPDPSSWKTAPLARFAGKGCDIDKHFSNMSIIIDTTFCGAWAGDPKVWEAGGCAKATGAQSCDAYVRDNPAAFGEAYWIFGDFKIFQKD
ncbi:mixed-linked glucanase precursor [Cryomyces antarcticus]